LIWQIYRIKKKTRLFIGDEISLFKSAYAFVILGSPDILFIGWDRRVLNSDECLLNQVPRRRCIPFHCDKLCGLVDINIDHTGKLLDLTFDRADTAIAGHVWHFEGFGFHAENSCLIDSKYIQNRAYHAF